MIKKLKALFVGNKVRIQMPKEMAQQIAEKGGFIYRAEWNCPCGKVLKIRAREDHFHGPSNYREDRNPDSRIFGHSILPSHELTWNGLAEERGWKTEPTLCPVCIRLAGPSA